MEILSNYDVLENVRKNLFSFTFLTAIAIVAVNSQQYENTDTKNIERLPFCDHEHSRTISPRLIYVTTLDGKLTALDSTKKGEVKWEVKTGPGPLISSNIHRLELTNNGQMVRMIPSLNGGIYKFDGESIDPIPITAENLLSSSFKFSDDLIISGGKETKSYGVSARTGQVLYECSMQGCVNNTDANYENSNINVAEDHDAQLDDVVVIRRQTQTVRAIEPRTGIERWNFSVGQHELDIIKSPECHDNKNEKFSDLHIKVIVPEGIICAFSKENPNNLLWKHQFDNPIVSAWKTEKNEQITGIDLFGSAQWIWDSDNDDIINQEGLISPSIYLGMYQKQLYIQESIKLHQLLTDKTNHFEYHLMEKGISNMPTIPWKPVPATKSTTILMIEDQSDDDGNKTELKMTEDENSAAITALSVLYASEYANGHGFYLYSSKDLNKTLNLCSSNATNISNNGQSFISNETIDLKEDEMPVITSMWYWWKQILVISLFTGILLNLLISPKIRKEREVVVIERHIPVPTALEATEESMSSLSKQRSVSESISNNSESFSSRFQSDFDLIQCLGKGGFGVVFEARNKLDDCTYAVKRIALPNKKEKRDRVMREVKTLANCEHQNIVRYFQAWVETPPPGWQEEEDSKWLKKDFSTSIEIESPDGTTLPSFPPKYSHLNDVNTGSDYVKNKSLSNWVSKINQDYNFDDCSFREECEKNCEEDDLSFIEFKSESQENSAMKKENNHSFSIDIHSKDSEKEICNKNNYNDDSGSFQIEFKHSTSNGSNNFVKEENQLENPKIIKQRNHKRPLSLDLSAANRNALIPLYDNYQNKKIDLTEMLDVTKEKPLLALPASKPNKVYLYIQMQLCRKESLRDWLREHRIEMREPYTQSIFQQIVDAVDYVHQKGLIHRDLKPGNIFFALDGQIRIGDFGLVTDMPETPNSSDNGSNGSSGNLLNSQLNIRYTQQVGTHLYMSPEQLQGLSYDFRVDIYSLGLIFFELLVYFNTEMERVKTLKELRDHHYPYEFQHKFPEEHDLLKSMLATKAIDRPTTSTIQEKLMNMVSWMINNTDTGKIRRLSEMSSSS